MAERFLKDSDYDDQVRGEIRQVLDNTPDQYKMKQAEKKGIAQMRKYLSSRYDVDRIFRVPAGDEPDTRDAFIVMTLVDVVLYHLWSKERGRDVPKVRNDRYQDALDWMKSVGNGEEISDLPAKQAGEVFGSVQIYSLHAPNNHKY